jgi:hypothetical protein
MKKYNTSKTTINDTDVIFYSSQRGWAIVIMPDNVRMDNHHGYPHIHYTPKGKKFEIKEKNVEILFDMVLENVTKNGRLNLNELKEGLL